MQVIASNSGAGAYACMASCRINVAGQSAIERFECNFALGANATEKTVCTAKGKGPRHYSEISPTRFVCQPR